jgi:hypothetical protein
MAASILFLLPVMALTTFPVQAHTTASEGHRHAAAQTVAVQEFTTAVNRYLELHRLLENPMSSLTWGSDFEQTERAREAHRKAIVEARIATPRGDIFTPRVAAYVRRELATAAALARIAGTHVTQAALERLPELPMELEYRFVDRDLVILDTETLLVVDMLAFALPPEPHTDVTPGEDEGLCAPEPAPVMKGSPCVTHPELEMCWS